MVSNDLEERDYPNNEEWEDIEKIFSYGNKKSHAIISKLRKGNNTPLRTNKDNPELVKQRVGGMNNILKTHNSNFRLRSLSRKNFDYIAIKFDPDRNKKGI